MIREHSQIIIQQSEGTVDQTCNPNTKKFKSKNQEQNVLKYIVDIGELNLDQRDYHTFDKLG